MITFAYRRFSPPPIQPRSNSQLWRRMRLPPECRPRAGADGRWPGFAQGAKHGGRKTRLFDIAPHTHHFSGGKAAFYIASPRLTGLLPRRRDAASTACHGRDAPPMTPASSNASFSQLASCCAWLGEIPCWLRARHDGFAHSAAPDGAPAAREDAPAHGGRRQLVHAAAILANYFARHTRHEPASMRHYFFFGHMLDTRRADAALRMMPFH